MGPVDDTGDTACLELGFLAPKGAEVCLEGPAVDGILVVCLALVVSRVHLSCGINFQLALYPVSLQLPF